MKHYTSPREKKVLILGLVSLIALPDAQLPAEVKPGMPQVGRGEVAGSNALRMLGGRRRLLHAGKLCMGGQVRSSWGAWVQRGMPPAGLPGQTRCQH